MRRIVLKLLAGSLIFAGVGYISSVVSQRKCEDAAALSIVHVQMEDRPFFIIMGDETSHVIFSRVGAKFTTYTAVRTPDVSPGKSRIRRLTWPDGQPMPHVDKGGRTASVSNARIFLPFLTSVEHEAFYASLGADGGFSHYLCFFGLTFKIIEETSWVS